MLECTINNKQCIIIRVNGALDIRCIILFPTISCKEICVGKQFSQLAETAFLGKPNIKVNTYQYKNLC